MGRGDRNSKGPGDPLNKLSLIEIAKQLNTSERNLEEPKMN